MNDARRADLAAFLRTRRARLRPSDVGLPDGTRRRTPGLRRQEVAQLAGMSVDYYVRLEQGRGPRPSRQVLSALARALMLTRDERAYLFRVAGETPPPSGGPSRELAPGLRYLIDGMRETPAYVLDAKYDILAECHVLHVPDTDQRLVVYCAEPGSPTQAAFRRLATLEPLPLTTTT